MLKAVLYSLIAVAPAYGDIVQWYFQGSVTSVNQTGDVSIDELVHVGDLVSGTLTYDTQAPDRGSGYNFGYSTRRHQVDWW